MPLVFSEQDAVIIATATIKERLGMFIPVMLSCVDHESMLTTFSCDLPLSISNAIGELRSAPETHSAGVELTTPALPKRSNIRSEPGRSVTYRDTRVAFAVCVKAPLVPVTVNG